MMSRLPPAESRDETSVRLTVPFKDFNLPEPCLRDLSTFFSHEYFFGLICFSGQINYIRIDPRDGGLITVFLTLVLEFNLSLSLTMQAHEHPHTYQSHAHLHTDTLAGKVLSELTGIRFFILVFFDVPSACSFSSSFAQPRNRFVSLSLSQHVSNQLLLF